MWSSELSDQAAVLMSQGSTQAVSRWGHYTDAPWDGSGSLTNTQHQFLFKPDTQEEYALTTGGYEGTTQTYYGVTGGSPSSTDRVIVNTDFTGMCDSSLCGLTNMAITSTNVFEVWFAGPTAAPTVPTPVPSAIPSSSPTNVPTMAPTTRKPTPSPTAYPTQFPTTGRPTVSPTGETAKPTPLPSPVPTAAPSFGRGPG